MNLLKIPFLLVWRLWFYVLILITVLLMSPFLFVLTIKESYYPTFWKLIRGWAHVLVYGMGFRIDKQLDEILARDIMIPRAEIIAVEESITFDELIKSANENELNALLMHQSAPVKVYAYRALLVQSMNVNSDFEQALLNDTSCVNLISKKQIIPTTVKEIVENDIRIYK